MAMVASPHWKVVDDDNGPSHEGYERRRAIGLRAKIVSPLVRAKSSMMRVECDDVGQMGIRGVEQLRKEARASKTTDVDPVTATPDDIPARD
ncbi:hypothetical protein BHM03_00016796 [Ensete ventricosum]|nr:hypothetical protein BHM03_00016796 [Ensete ventricosum]